MSNKSESITELAQALVKFQEQCPNIPLNESVTVKLKSGGQYSFRYASIDHILNLIRPILSKHGLAFTQLLGKPGVVSTVLMHSSGQWIESITEVNSTGSIQDIGGHYTYLKRYALCAILGVVAESDDDAGSGDDREVVAKTTQPQNENGSTMPRNMNAETTKPENSKVDDADKKWLNQFKDKAKTEETPEFQNAVKALMEGKTIIDIRKVYKVSKEVESALNNVI